jgi:large subunit ribosomal protein L29
MTKAKDLRDQSLHELEANYKEFCRKLFDLKNQFKGPKKVGKPHEIERARKDIARCLTVMTEKRNNA